MRIDKFLSNMGLGTRSDIKKIISHENITVNGEIIKKIGTQINENKDIVIFRNEQIKYIKNVYIMLNKPFGVISATTDKIHKTVIDLVSEEYGNRKLFPVGRLDIDTEGLLLITDDGNFNHELMAPKKHVSKTYFAKINGKVSDETIKIFKKGIILEDKTEFKPAYLVIIKKDENISEIELTITEGKFHQVKRMFEYVDMKVIYLKRISIGNLKLDEKLYLGQYRELTENEKKLLKP